MVKSAAGVYLQWVQDCPQDGAPQWARVHRAVRRAIDAGTLQPGMRLPSARQLARDWGVSRGAVDEGFAQLQAEGLLERRVGDGTYVAAAARPSAQTPHREPAAAARRVLKDFGAIQVPASRVEGAVVPRRAYALHPRAMPLDSFPLAAWRRLLVQAHEPAQQALMEGGPPGGLPALREAIARHLALARGVTCSPSQVLVLSGPREGITAVVRQLLQPGDTVAVEDPSHPSLPQLFSILGARVQGVPLDDEGFVVDALPPATRAVYLHPLAQYPLGQRTRLARGRALLAWAEAQQGWIVEGHYNDEWVPRSEQTPTLFARDFAGRVLLLGTFEGVMFPSLRVGYLVLPEALAARFIASQARLGERVPLATQWAVAQFIDSGGLTRHLERVRRDLSERRERVAGHLARLLPAAVRLGPMETGAQLCLHLPPVLADTAVVAALRAQRVVVEPVSPMTWPPGRVNAIVFGYMGWTEAEVLAALDKIAAVISAALAGYQGASEKA